MTNLKDAMKSIDWGLVKIQYELFGETAQSLAEEYDTTLRMIQYAIDDGGWEPKPIATAITEWQNLDNIEDLPSDMLDQVKDRMSILFTLKQSALNPRYIAIETAILGKAQQVIQNIGPDHPNAAAALKAMAETFHMLREANGVGGSKNDEPDNSITVNIQQRVDRAGQISASTADQAAIEIKTAGVKRLPPAVKF